LTTAATLALGMGRPLDGAVAFGWAIALADADADGMADSEEPEPRLQPTTEAKAPTRVAVAPGIAGKRRIGLA
jgi:hypothetical protein